MHPQVVLERELLDIAGISRHRKDLLQRMIQLLLGPEYVDPPEVPSRCGMMRMDSVGVVGGGDAGKVRPVC